MKLQSILMLTLLAAALPASAEIYRWVDAQGRVHYSDRPVPGATRVVGVLSHPSDAEAIAERNAADQKKREEDQAAARKEQTNQNAAKDVNKDMAKLQEERCKKAKDDYRIATESQRLYRVNKDGEREYLSDADLAQARIDARKKLDEACGKQPG